ncbi:MAG: site-specific DNA-methyltransferase [Candidatus Thermoplasmatota archaeon]|nr:site-specific DNA-methyltransferase [Candidatus Thermoplasmatota archaeon]
MLSCRTDSSAYINISRFFLVGSSNPQSSIRRKDGLIGKNHRPYDVWIDIPKLVPGFMAQPEVVLKPGKKKAMVLPNQLPEKLVWRCVRASTKEGDLVVDPFLGMGTTMRVCGKHGRSFIGFEINKEYQQHLEEQKILLIKLKEKKKSTQSKFQLTDIVK